MMAKMILQMSLRNEVSYAVRSNATGAGNGSAQGSRDVLPVPV